MSDHDMAKPWLDWVEMQDRSPPDDGTPILIALPMGNGEAIYAAAHVNAYGKLEELNGADIAFSPTVWAIIPTPGER
jgi:hypothetical protein